MEENESMEEVLITEDRSLCGPDTPAETGVLELVPETPEPDLRETTRQTDEYLAWLASLE